MSIQSTGPIDRAVHALGAGELRMARPSGFDETAALDAAIECIRRRGYEATSVRDLTACTGGHGTEPYEQKTQQSPAFGRSRVPQPVHS
jgi:hypothetical protein